MTDKSFSVDTSDEVARFSQRVAAAVLAIAGLIALAVWVSPYSATETDFLSRLLPPSGQHWLGTDHLGRDIGTRLAYGTVWSLGLSFAISLIGLIIGTMVGLIAARIGWLGDFALMRLTDSFFAFPELIAAVTVAGLFGPSTTNLVIALIVVSWMKFTRLARSLALSIGEKDFVIQAQLNGLSPLRILVGQILPNIMPSLLVLWSQSWARTILAVSGLSFLGFGVQPPQAEWGAMLLDGKAHMQTSPHMMIFPGLAVLLAVLAINLTGDKLRDILSKQR